MLPFFAAAPTAMFQQVDLDQLQRPSTGVELVDRLRAFGPHSGLMEALPGSVLVVAFLLFLAGACLVAYRDAGLQLWLGVLLVQLLEVLLAPSFYDHYTAYAGPSVVIVWAVLVSRFYAAATVTAASRRVVKASLGATAVVAACAFLLTGLRIVGGVAVDRARLADFLGRHSCTWASSETLQVGGTDRRQIQDDCPVWVDGFGVLMDVSRGGVSRQKPLEEQARYVEPWQRGLQRQFASSDAIVIEPREAQLWSSETKQRFLQRFRLADRSGELVFWTKR